MGGYLRRNAPRGSSANWTEVVREYKQGVQQDMELSDDGIVAFEDDSNTSTDDSLLSSSSCFVCWKALFRCKIIEIGCEVGLEWSEVRKTGIQLWLNFEHNHFGKRE